LMEEVILIYELTVLKVDLVYKIVF